MLTEEEVAARQIYNQQCAGEQPRGPPLEAASVGGERNGDDGVVVGNDAV